MEVTSRDQIEALTSARTDVHQHVWTDPLLWELERREELPFVREEKGLTVLHLAGERPYVIDREAETCDRRAALVELDGLDRAIVCLSSPLGIELLAREQSIALLDAYHEGALALGDRFDVWGAIALDRLDPADVDSVLDRGCVGLSLPAGALASLAGLARLAPVLERLEGRGAPLFVHPGPGPRRAPLSDPLWWVALTSYVAEMQAAWLAFLSAGRRAHPRLRVVFSMLAGLAPLQAERLASRGGPALPRADELTFYDISSYGPHSVRAMADAVGARQLLYGSDRPVVDPAETRGAQLLDWGQLAESAGRALGGMPVGAVVGG
jgi:6-methylsalicylate decarboxylase